MLEFYESPNPPKNTFTNAKEYSTLLFLNLAKTHQHINLVSSRFTVHFSVSKWQFISHGGILHEELANKGEEEFDLLSFKLKFIATLTQLRNEKYIWKSDNYYYYYNSCSLAWAYINDGHPREEWTLLPTKPPGSVFLYQTMDKYYTNILVQKIPKTSNCAKLQRLLEVDFTWNAISRIDHWSNLHDIVGLI